MIKFLSDDENFEAERNKVANCISMQWVADFLSKAKIDETAERVVTENAGGGD